MRLPVPDGYVRIKQGPATAVVVAPCAPAVDSILGERPLYDWARVHAERQAYTGRGPAYGVPLPQCDVRVVVRRARHGGIFAPLLGEVFLAPTRAPRELAMSLFLRQLGVATPAIIGFVTYAVAPLLRRADVFTAEVPNAADLGDYLARATGIAERQDAWRATARLLQRLSQNGVWHPDLNAKNVLIAATSTSSEAAETQLPSPIAVVLDIDRVRLVVPGDPQVAEANLERLLRSLRKRAGDPRNGPPVSEEELAEFSALTRDTGPAPVS
ncbi:MAG: lipopolysaccharide kinase InaA family protein [Gemmatimonadaceae bacterium]